jgi:hypothetical protein
MSATTKFQAECRWESPLLAPESWDRAWWRLARRADHARIAGSAARRANRERRGVPPAPRMARRGY